MALTCFPFPFRGRVREGAHFQSRRTCRPHILYPSPFRGRGWKGVSAAQAAKSSSRGLAPPSPLPPPNHPPNPPHPSRCVLMAGGLGGIRAPCLAPASHPAKTAGARLGLRPLPPSRSSPSSINSLRLSLLNNKKLHNERLIWLTR